MSVRVEGDIALMQGRIALETVMVSLMGCEFLATSR